MAKRTTGEQLRKKTLKRPKVKTEYEALAPDFEMKRQMIAMRRAAGLTQEQVVEKSDHALRRVTGQSAQ